MKLLTVCLIIPGILIGFFLWKYSLNDRNITSWHMVNVNARSLQGDANVIQIKDKVIMVDAGYKSEAEASLIPYLKQKGINHVNYFYVSHPHRDHYEGVATLWSAGITIDEIYYNMPPNDVSDCCYDKDHFVKFLNQAKSRGSKVKDVSKGHLIHLPNNSSMEVLHAETRTKINNSNVDVNDMSLIMKWKIYGFEILFTGDLNYTVGQYLSDDPRMDSDFLKVPHHGARGIAPDSFFDAVNPSYVLVPGRKIHWCGERGQQAREWTYKNKLPHWVNGLHGTIRVDFNSNGGKIFREKNDTCLPEIKKPSLDDSSLLNPYQFSKEL